MDKIKSILMVCTGNSCRSVMAEGLFKKYLKEAGKEDIEVTSAGVMTVDGFPPTDKTIDVMKSEGVDVSGYRSKRLTADLIGRSDLILAMEDTHKYFVIRLNPMVEDKVHILKKYGLDDTLKHSKGDGVPDPIGRSIEFYRSSLEIIKKEAKRIVELL